MSVLLSSRCHDMNGDSTFTSSITNILKHSVAASLKWSTFGANFFGKLILITTGFMLTRPRNRCGLISKRYSMLQVSVSCIKNLLRTCGRLVVLLHFWNAHLQCLRDLHHSREILGLGTNHKGSVSLSTYTSWPAVSHKYYSNSLRNASCQAFSYPRKRDRDIHFHLVSVFYRSPGVGGSTSI